IVSPQEGHSISVPAPVLSTANSCSHFGQLKMTSIGGLLFAECDLRICGVAVQHQQKVFLFVRLFELLDSWPNRRSFGRAFLDLTENAFGFGWVVPRDHDAVIQLDPGLAGVLQGLAVSLEP